MIAQLTRIQPRHRSTVELLQRLIELDRMLIDGIHFKTAASELGVVCRTVRRDLAVLIALGVSVHSTSEADGRKTYYSCRRLFQDPTPANCTRPIVAFAEDLQRTGASGEEIMEAVRATGVKSLAFGDFMTLMRIVEDAE